MLLQAEIKKKTKQEKSKKKNNPQNTIIMSNVF
jgi:hypothetical protein